MCTLCTGLDVNIQTWYNPEDYNSDTNNYDDSGNFLKKDSE